MSTPLRVALTAWEWQLPVLVWVALAGGLYGVGGRRLQNRVAGALPLWRACCFAAGLASLTAALCSPIAVYDERAFCLHMLQHLLLLIAVPALLWLGAPQAVLLWGLPRGLRRGVPGLVARHPAGRALVRLATPPWAVWPYLATVALWHIPRLYDLAQGRTVAHDLEHLTFLSAGLLFWGGLLRPGVPGRRGPAALLCVMAAALEGGLLGGLFTFAARPLYATYQRAAPAWGLAPLADQRLGGIVMWLGGGLVYTLAAFLLVFEAALAEERRRQAPRPGHAPATR